jgi:phage terminase large subunit-like protein
MNGDSYKRLSELLKRWVSSNGSGGQLVNPKSNGILITKQASGTAKIDPLMAAFNAIALVSTNPWSARPSIFVI